MNFLKWLFRRPGQPRRLSDIDIRWLAAERAGMESHQQLSQQLIAFIKAKGDELAEDRRRLAETTLWLANFNENERWAEYRAKGEACP